MKVPKIIDTYTAIIAEYDSLTLRLKTAHENFTDRCT